MTDASINRGIDTFCLKPCRIEEPIAYTVDSTGASITPDSSVTLINQYCQKLRGDE